MRRCLNMPLAELEAYARGDFPYIMAENGHLVDYWYVDSAVLNTPDVKMDIEYNGTSGFAGDYKELVKKYATTERC